MSLPDPRSARVGEAPVLEVDRAVIGYFLKSFPKRADGSPILPPTPSTPSVTTSLNISTSFSIALIAIFTLSRLGVRIFSKQIAFGWDDVAIIPGALIAIIRTIFFLVAGIYGGSGDHVQNITYAQYAYTYKFIGGGTGLYYAATGIVKVSVTLLLYRLVGGKTACLIWRVFLNILLIVCGLYTILATFLIAFRCGDPRFLSDAIYAFEHPKTKCIEFTPLNLGLSVMHCILDFVIFFAALSLLWGKKFSNWKKLRLLILFSAAFATVFTSIYRITASFDPGRAASYDYTYAYKARVWATVDLVLSYVVASMPVVSTGFSWILCRLKLKSLQPPRIPGLASDKSTASTDGEVTQVTQITQNDEESQVNRPLKQNTVTKLDRTGPPSS